MNLCRACGEDFSSVAMFDAHRVGKHAYLYGPDRPDGRRCLPPAEMLAKGWRLDVHNRWSDPARAEVAERMAAKRAA